MTQQKVACVQRFGFKPGTVAGNEKPMADLIAKQLDAPERWEFALELWVCWVGALREYKPNAVVLRRPGMVTEHQDNPVLDVDREPGEHPAHLGTQRHQGIQDKSMRRFFQRLRGARHGCSKMER